MKSGKRLAVRAAATMLASLVAACGGDGGSGDAARPDVSAKTLEQEREGIPYEGAVTVRGGEQTMAKLAAVAAIPADAHLKGVWSSVIDWPLIAIHLVQLPDGRVLSYGSGLDGTQTGFLNYDIWTPGAGTGPSSHLTLNNQSEVDVFCNAQLVLPQPGAGVVLVGGDITVQGQSTNTANYNSAVFNPANNSLVKTNDLNRARWYATATTLLNGETYIQGGAGGTDRPEIRGTNGVYRLLSGANTSSIDYWYPRNFLAPDGRIFGFDAYAKMYYVNTSGNGSFTPAGQFNAGVAGTMSSAVMYRPGKILQFNGNSNGALIIDINGASPVVTPTGSMSSRRQLLSGTMLPNGQVLATGGSERYNELIGVNNSAEMWNPATGVWTVGSSGAMARLYHGNALLLADATVLVAGGGAPGPLTNLNAEIYYPPYLFTSGGVEAPRPRIAAAPSQLVVGAGFTLDFADAASISRVVLIKTGSATHGWNMEQRYLELAFTASGQRLNVQMSSRAADTPPGYYFLFVLDAQGVPSVAKTVWINVAGTPNPNTAPVITNPGNRSGTVGTAVSLQVQASDADGNPLSFSATGLPPGLSISAGGLITGTPSTAGTYSSVVTVSDGTTTATANFTWTISSGAALELDPIPTPAPAQSGTDVTFTARATGNNPQFSWNFGDGSPATAFSSATTTLHRYNAAGIFFVTVTARDASGAQKVQSFMQVVHLPLTARAPTLSSSVAYDRNGNGPARVWVVNPDNDSVSVFNANTGARIAEVVVGTSPRSVAIDAAGHAWVTSRRSANVQIIDRASLTVSRTIAMPRVAQPHGIAMSPAGDFAYIVLEATGQLLKYQTSNFTKLKTLGVGANPRHVAVSADGATVFVSRYITPPMPGESTVTVQTTNPDGSPAGGEIVKVRASDLVSLGKIVLGFSTKSDAENRGRGVPNYLGAMSISPDGSQAWIPSKQDNIQRGVLRDGQDLNFQNTVRAISSRVAMGSGVEDLAKRIDHDNASVASAAAFDPLGVLLFVALETSREVAVINAHSGQEMFRFEVGRAPEGMSISPDGRILYVDNFMDRTLGIYDLSPFWNEGRLAADVVATPRTIGTDKLAAQVLTGKQFFYDARDTRLSRDRYMSCATCHSDAGHDGRVWDLTNLGEGLRNTIALRGRGGMLHGFLHWSANFDEVQDFEGQIRTLAGGTGLMSDSAFFAGTRSQPLGATKTGVSSELDSLAAYLESLAAFEYSPHRPSGKTLSAAATSGKALFQSKGCGSCHAGSAYTGSGAGVRIDIGTDQASSGSPLVNGVDIPTLRGVWATAPYLHNGSQATVEGAIAAHSGVSLTTTERSDLAAFVRSIGREEPAPVVAPGPGSGLRGQYFNNRTLSGSPVLTRNEMVNFSWSQSPGTGVPSNNFSARWTGRVVAPTTGSYYFQTIANDGVRLYVKGQLVVNNWTAHASNETVTSAAVNLVAGETAPVVLEYYDVSGGAIVRLRWRTPGNTTIVPIPIDRLLPN
ncbi:MAG: hypothetical protein K0Q76_822 [Panacagrimonas sp.]|nr:PA14 domain-containing protein [Panacagrimonas sp.]MCC2655714.1 hypothetical protein [Panacagrimonas sp.]